MKLLTLIAILISASAFADLKPLNWDQMLKACQGPGNLPGQQTEVGPITIRCNDTRMTWEDYAASRTFHQARTVQSTLTSNKYAVNGDKDKVKICDVKLPCTEYRQIELSLTKNFPTGCAEIAKYSNGSAFCEEKMGHEYETNSASYEKTTIKEAAGFCTGSSSSGE